MDTKPATTTPRIYVACLAAYNNGRLHGAWIGADQPAWDIYAEIAKMLRASPIDEAEEFAIHDYEGFKGVQTGEYTCIDRVSRIAAFLAEHGALGGRLIDYFGGDLAEAEAAITDQYAGEYPSLADFAQELTEESTTIPENLRFYIDYERMAHDLAINDVLAIEGTAGAIHVFWNR